MRTGTGTAHRVTSCLYFTNAACLSPFHYVYPTALWVAVYCLFASDVSLEVIFHEGRSVDMFFRDISNVANDSFGEQASVIVS